MFGIRVNRQHPLWKPLSPRGRGAMLAIALALIPVVALAAWILIRVYHQVTVTAAILGPVNASAPSVIGCTLVSWDAGPGAAGTMILTWPNAAPGGSCTISQSFSSNGSSPLFGFLDASGAPEGVIVDDESCGGQLVNGTPAVFSWSMSLDEDLVSQGQVLGPFQVLRSFQASSPTCP